MALDLQLVPNMQIGLMMMVTLLAGWLGTAVAETPPCVKVYRSLHQNYLVKVGELRSQRKLAKVGMVGGVLAGGLCLRKLGAIACGGLFGGETVGAAFWHTQLGKQIKTLEESYRIYEVYYEVTNEEDNGPFSRQLFTELDTPQSQQKVVLDKLVQLMESGEICADGAPAKSLDEIREILRSAQAI